jgi:hypothetical protein
VADGYWAGLLWLAAVVLWWSGWREELGGDLSPRAVRWFLALWPAGWLAGHALPPGGRPLLMALAMLSVAFLLCRPLDAERRLTVWSVATLGGAILFLLTHPAVWLHGWIRLDPARDLPVLLGLFVALTLRSAREQLAALSLALLVAFCGSRWLIPPPAAWPTAATWADMWWLAAAVGRAVAFSLYRMTQALRQKWRGKAGNRA